MEQERERRECFTEVSYDEWDGRHYGAITIPVYQASLFAFEKYADFEQAGQDLLHHHVYSRGNNPTVEYLEQKLAALEGGEAARCFASGMAAITATILSLVESGDHIVCVDQVYGPTRQFLGTYMTRFGLATTFVDGASLEAVRAAVQPNTRLIYLESPTTMLFELQNLTAVTALAREAGIITMIDNTWASPCYQQPIALGVDLVVHSLTKYVSGHSDCIGGVVIGSQERIDKLSNGEFMTLGGIMAPQIAALMTRGLRTLPLRMQRHAISGLKVAEHVERLDFVTRVNHPGLPSHPQHALALKQMNGFGSLFSFESAEPLEKLRRFADHLKYFKIGVSWGGFESLITVNRLVGNGGSVVGERQIVRLYIGQEDPGELIADIDQAWRAATLQDQAAAAAEVAAAGGATENS
jgi:cystathionine beta-lyase